MATTTPTGVRGGHAEQGDPKTPAGPPMTHRQIMEALAGLLLGMFVAILSSTVVSNALPEIIADLGGGQSAYTWVITASLLAMTATTPLWGKLADLFSKKLLVQIALIIYVAGSVVAGLSTSSGMLIVCRVFQGIGVGGLSALAQIVMAAMISPRERGRYSGYIGAVFAVATVGGPLLGGVITDTSWMGWRWCFYVGVPFAVVALVVIQKTLNLPVVKRKVKIDWWGAFFISAAVSLLLLWVTFAGDKYAWASWQTYAMLAGSALLTAVFVFIETRAGEPIIPLRLFRNRTITLTSIASLFVGIGMFAGTIFFSQYFQLARGESPTMSGVLTIPMIAGLFLSSTVSGQIITRTGRWKGWLVGGGLMLTAGLAMLGTIRYDTPYWQVAVYMLVMGLGVGMMMQNLVLATQNQVAVADLGAASSVVTFFRSLGGAIGVSALGAVMANRVARYVKEGLADLGPEGAALGHGGAAGGGIPDMDKLPEPFRMIVEAAYGHGVGDIFLFAAPAAFLAFVVTLFIKEVALKTNVADVVDDPMPPLTPGTPVRGVVRDAEGVPVAMAALTLISLDGRQLGRSVARPDGGYALDAPGSGSYVLIASADGFQPQASTVVAAGEPLAHDILLAGTSGLAGTVRSAEGGDPVVAGLRPPALPVGIGGRGATRVEAELRSGALVRGVVRSGSGRSPLPAARVTLLDAAGNVVATSTTGYDGVYAFPDLDAGEYSVIATGYPPVVAALTVAGPGVDGHDIELAHPGE